MKIHSKNKWPKGTYLFNEGKVVWLYFFNVNTNFALTVKVIFAANKNLKRIQNVKLDRLNYAYAAAKHDINEPKIVQVLTK